MKILRKIIEIDEELCDGCGECIPNCAEGALEIVDGKARIVADKYCDGLGACLGECPNGALRIVEREAEEFNEEAVEKYLEEKEAGETPVQRQACPSARILSFSPAAGNKPAGETETESALSHWPIQVRLVPPNAPFLKGAELLVLADCVPVVFPSLHSDLLKGKAVLLGCPKLDDASEYVERFAAIFKTAGIKRITVAVMEVPCCSGLLGIIEKAMEKAEKEIPVEQIVFSTRGKILDPT